jgi:hypothetical protein
MKNAIFVSIWDGNLVLESACKINEKTHEIYDIEKYNISVEILEEEYVIIDGAKYPACNIDEYTGDGYYYN